MKTLPSSFLSCGLLALLWLCLVYKFEDGIVPTSVPEPGSLILAGLGLAVLRCVSRASAPERLPAPGAQA